MTQLVTAGKQSVMTWLQNVLVAASWVHDAAHSLPLELWSVEEARDSVLAPPLKPFCCLRTFQCRHSARDSNQSLIWSLLQIEGTGNMDVLIRTLYTWATVTICVTTQPEIAWYWYCSSKWNIRVTLVDFLPVSAIERHPCSVASFRWQADLKMATKWWHVELSGHCCCGIIAVWYCYRGITLISTPAGTTMGLKDSEWGQTGAMRMAGTLGCIMDAPAAAAYAVLPVGVEMINPETCVCHER